MSYIFYQITAVFLLTRYRRHVKSRFSALLVAREIDQVLNHTYIKSIYFSFLSTSKPQYRCCIVTGMIQI